MTTGKSSVASLGAPKDTPVEGAECGAYGCGILEIGDYDQKSNTIVTWVENLLPPPPPATPTPTPASTLGQVHMGLTLASLTETELR